MRPQVSPAIKREQMTRFRGRFAGVCQRKPGWLLRITLEGERST